MPHIVAIHSFRRGTGKSHITANIAALLAASGRRVAVIDTDISVPSMHFLFGLGDDVPPRTLNAYLLGLCDIGKTVCDVTDRLLPGSYGRLLLIPASIGAADITSLLRIGYDAERLGDGLHELVDELDLDALLIDIPAGLNEQSLILSALADVLVVVLRLDRQDYQGTSVILEMARRLAVARVALVVNQMPPAYDPAAIAASVAETYGCPVAAVLPHIDQLQALSSTAIFVLRHPDHPLTTALRVLAESLIT